MLPTRLVRFVLASLPLVLAMTGSTVAHPTVEREIAAADQALATGHASARDFLRRAELLRTSGSWGRAEADYATALQLDPDLHVARLGLADLLLATSRAVEATAEVDRYLEAVPGDPDALLLRARTLAASGRPSEAVHAYDVALPNVRDAQPDHYLERARVVMSSPARNVTSSRIARAIRGLDEGLDRLGESPALLLRSVELELARGDVDGAVARLDRLAASAPHPGAVLARKAGVLRDAGRHLESLVAATEALAAIENLSAGTRARDETRALEAQVRSLLALDNDETQGGSR